MSEMRDNTGQQPGSGDPGAGSRPAGTTQPGTPAQAGGTPQPGTVKRDPALGHTEQPMTGQPVAGQPATGQPVAGQPATAAREAQRGDTLQRDPAQAQHYVPRPAPGYDDAARYDAAAASEPASGAALGLTIMAACFMMVSGLLGFFEGLAMVIRGSFFVALPNYAFSLSAVGWGWVHLAIGAVVFTAGAALFAGQTWARIVGVVVASIAIIANFVALPYYPVWSVVVIALSAFVIWALLTPRNHYV
jgi:hypothetical protein